MTRPASDNPHPEPESSPDPRSGDRWTAAKQADFLRQLSATHSVSAAAKAVGMSRQSAYRLRSRLKGKSFDLAWDVAFHHSYDNLAHAALERALNGVEVPVFFQGEQIGSYRKFNERLTVALLERSTVVGKVPLLGKHGPTAERHARAFDGLVAKVERGEEVETRCETDPEMPGELDSLRSLVSPGITNAEIMAVLRGFGDS